MINGRELRAARGGLPAEVPTTQSDADSSDLYGDYERDLAAELADLLNAPGPSAMSVNAQPEGLLDRLETRALPPPLPQKRHAGTLEIASDESPRDADPRAQAERGGPFVPAARPSNDFTDDDDDLPLAFSWRHEPHQPARGWMHRQVKYGALGLVAGLVLIVPPVLVATDTVRVPDALTAAFDGGAWSPWTADRQQPPRLAQLPPPQATQAAPRPQAQAVPAGEAPAPVGEGRVLRADAGSVLATATGIATGAPRTPATPDETRSAMAAPLDPVAETARLLSEGERLIRQGDISGARAPLSKAAAAGSPHAMLALGETFDPNMLAAWGAPHAIKPDVVTARLFYGRALNGGLEAARKRLELLQ